MTFVFGLAIGALIGGLFIADRNRTADSGEVAGELAARDVAIADTQSELQRLQAELETALDETDGEPGPLQLALEEAAAKQIEIDDLSAQLGAALAELDRLNSAYADDAVVVHYVYVLETMHAFAESGYVDGSTFVEDPALGDALTEIGSQPLRDTVEVGFLESGPGEAAPFFSALQQVLNHMQTALIE